MWSAPGGHLIIDLSQHKLPIEFLLKRFSTNPSTRWPPDDDQGDDSDPGGEPPPWKKRATGGKGAKHNPTGRVLAGTTGVPLNAPEEYDEMEDEREQMDEERREQHLRAAAFLHSGAATNYTPSVPENRNDEDPGKRPDPSGEEPGGDEKDSDVVIESGPIDVEIEADEVPEDPRPPERESTAADEHAHEVHDSHAHGEAHVHEHGAMHENGHEPEQEHDLVEHHGGLLSVVDGH